MESGGSKTLWSLTKFCFDFTFLKSDNQEFWKAVFVLSTHSYALSFESTTKPVGVVCLSLTGI